VIEGWAVVDGYQPDGDTIRFVPDAMARVLALPRGHLVAAGADTSVPVRLEGIDAPELHYAGAEQPAARVALETLLREIGWPPPGGARGVAAVGTAPRGVRVRVMTRSCDAHGRVIGYVFSTAGKAPLAVPSVERVESSVNARLLEAGVVYPLAYSSQPERDRALFAALAKTARRAGRGVWSRDRSRDGFALRSEASLGRYGALVFPKVFRRSVAFFREAARGVHFREWLRSGSVANDAVRVAGGAWRRLSDILTERDGRLHVTCDVIGVTFAEA
jgi:endonuclease YncB( thermonuclease family)